MSFLGDKSFRPYDEDPDIVLFIMWGQSHMAGADSYVGHINFDLNTLDAYTTEMSYTVNLRLNLSLEPSLGPTNCWIFDRCVKDNKDLSAVKDTLTDSYSQWRRLTVGYGGIGYYPWLRDDTEPDPERPLVLECFGPELAFADAYQKATGKRVGIVKYAIGGSTVVQNDGTPTASWNAAHRNEGGRIGKLLDLYWGPAKAAAVSLVGGDSSKVKIGGILQMIGFTDANSEVSSLAYEQNIRDIISLLRSEILPGDPTSIPYLISKTPYTNTPTIVEPYRTYLDNNRAAQETIAGDTTNVSFVETSYIRQRDAVYTPRLHFDGYGNLQLGTSFARWALAQTPVDAF